MDWRAVEGEVLWRDLGSREYLGVNRSGAVLWRELAAGATRGALVGRLVADAGIDAAGAGIDVERFLDQLRERVLLAEETPGTGAGAAGGGQRRSS